jgi:TolB-like protein/DNA-binding winged helix-turn-helix (wHTH) protein/Flp pilus assembly protein TadD
MSLPREPEPHLSEAGEFRLNEWTVRPEEGTVSAGERSVHLEPRVMDVLVHLAGQPGRVVSKEELLGAVWDGAVVEEGVLSQTIHVIRRALGDDAREPRFIQTVPKRGYRMVAEVVPVSPAPPVSPIEPAAPAPQPAPAPAPATERAAPRRLFAGLGLLVVVVLGIAWARFGTRPSPRIVVLPFSSLNRPEKAFFADGLTEEITQDLTSLPALQVISRTSARSYAGTRKPLPRIGEELGVDYVVEGSVLWNDENRVRITSRLIRVDGDVSVWSDSFDRETGDLFDVHEEIARQVRGGLGVALQSGERQGAPAPPTRSLDAYAAYLRGLELKNQPFYSERSLNQAVPLLQRAVDLDPGFAAAWAELSQVHSYLAFNSDRSPARTRMAKAALDRAMALAPGLPSVRLAGAYYSYRCLDDYDLALRQLEEISRASPNDPEVLQALGFVLRRRGRLGEAIDNLERAFALDPRTVKLVWAIAETHRARRDYEEADRQYAKAIELAPDQAYFWEERALNRLAWTGRIEEARKVLDQAPMRDDAGLLAVRFQLDFYDRKYDRALARLAPERLAQLAPAEQSRLAILAMIARDRLGDPAGAVAQARAAAAALNDQIARSPGEPFLRAYLALALARLGRVDDAWRYMDLAAQQKRSDLFTGPRVLELRAALLASLGRRDEAIRQLDSLLTSAYQMSIGPADLRLSPLWDPLRGDPRFAERARR